MTSSRPIKHHQKKFCVLSSRTLNLFKVQSIVMSKNMLDVIDATSHDHLHCPKQSRTRCHQCHEAPTKSTNLMRFTLKKPARGQVTMEVTRVNFSRALPLIKDTLSWCDFIALDVEFTGLGASRTNQLDTPSRRYQMARETAEEFPPCQVGLAMFGRGDTDDDKREWQAVVANVYVCQRAVFGGGRGRYPKVDRMWMMQASSVEFLRKSGFDFGKWLGEGVDWLRGDGEVEMRRVLEEDVLVAGGKGRRKGKGGLSEDDGVFVGEVEGRVRKWFKGKDKQLVLKEARSRVRKALVYDMVGGKFPTVTAERMDFGFDDTCVCLQKCSSVKEAKRKSLESREKDREDFIERRMKKHVGFRAVIDAIIESRKPVLVHNCLLDLTKIVANFISPLPPTLPEFKTLVASKFPTLFDTKYMSTSLSFKVPWLGAALRSATGSSLIEQFLMLQKHKKVAEIGVTQFPLVSQDDAYSTDLYTEYPEDQNAKENGKDSRNAHDAGYDAFATGRLFLQFLSIMGHENEIDFKAEDIQKLANKVALTGCGGYTYLGLAPQSVEPNEYMNRNDVLVVDGISPEKEGERLDHRRYEQVTKELLKGTKFIYDRRIIETGLILLVLTVKNKKEHAEGKDKDLQEKDTPGPAPVEDTGGETQTREEVSPAAIGHELNGRAIEIQPVPSPETEQNGTKGIDTACEGQGQEKTDHQSEKWLAKVFANGKSLGLSVEKYKDVMAKDPSERKRAEVRERKRRRLV